MLDDEERIRALARDARAGGSRDQLGEAVAALDHDRQAAVLRAFALFFQLVNIAEQHHRIRRRREYEAEGRDPARVARRGVRAARRRRRRRRRAPGGRRAPARRARPHRAPDRGDAPHRARGAPARRGAPCARSTTTARPRRSGSASRTRSRRRSPCSGRPTRSAPSDHGSWTRSARACGSSSRASGTRFPTSSVPSALGCERAGGALRFGSWIGGDLDGNPNVGAGDDRGRARACPARSRATSTARS